VEHLDSLTVLVEKPLSYVFPIVDTRNEFTHFPAPAAESLGKPGRPERDRVLQYNWILRLLLEACFLNAVGLANEEICRFVSRSDTYRQRGSATKGLRRAKGPARVRTLIAPGFAGISPDCRAQKTLGMFTRRVCGVGRVPRGNGACRTPVVPSQSCQSAESCPSSNSSNGSAMARSPSDE
jgi:hypothetical protein